MAAQPNGHNPDDGAANLDERSTISEVSTADHGESEDDDEEDEEPKLKYDRLTGYLGSVYRNGDATSSFLVGGDKMIIGTHNGHVNVLSLPSFQSLRFYRAHSASITSVSVSPFPPPMPDFRAELPTRSATEPPNRAVEQRVPTSASVNAAGAGRNQRQVVPLPATPSNSIYVATSSMDGQVCVFSLVDPKDIMLRNFRRPLNAVALSPEYKSDKQFLSGGLAGNLILTQGGRAGVSAEANTNSAAAAASGWLGSIGLGSNTGKDAVLHSGEGTISTIKWSLSGKYVAWANEQGIKIMRSNVKLESADAELAWRRIAHVDRPYHGQWEDMAGVWKARLEWADDQKLESDGDAVLSNGLERPSSASKPGSRPGVFRKEKLLVGWGDTAWVIHVDPGGVGNGRHVPERSIGRADIIHKLRFDDCIISGLSLYTPSILLVLAYRTRDDDNKPIASAAQEASSPKRGVHHRNNGIQPELRLINAKTSEEVDVDTLTISRYETLSANDYHLSTMYVPTLQAGTSAQRGALEAIGEGLWDAGMSARRIFSSGASIVSLTSSGDTAKPPSRGSSAQTAVSATAKPVVLKGAQSVASTAGLKIYIHSPYDCVIGSKRDLADHLTWLLEHKKYDEAWGLVNDHPEAIIPHAMPVEDTSSVSSPASTIKRQGSMVDFFADDSSQTTLSAERIHNSYVEKEKRRIGDLWLQQLVAVKDWKTAGKVAGKVLGTSSRWEHWVWTFAQAGQFDAITPYIPTKQLHPPLPSIVYEMVLGNYIIRDRLKVKELLDLWEPELFDTKAIISAIEGRLSSGDVREDSVEDGERGRDWRILLECLAKLYIADARPKDALSCYFRTQNAEAAMSLIRDHRLMSAVADDIPGFIMLRVSKEQMKSAPLEELEEASSEAIQLLIDEAYQGIVSPHAVVEQLQEKGLSYQPFLFFYLRSLWKGEGAETQSRGRHDRLVHEGKALVEDFGDLAVELFAEYDRPLLMNLLKSSESYDFEKAVAECDARQYIPELVYILSKTGQTKKALFLIIEKLGDVSYAISFAKDQDDPDLWDDLLDYSMDKPHFIRGLLEEVGTAIDPIQLVRRIPEGLEIEGLRDGIRRMVREFEIQFSISDGVAKVLRSEVAQAMDTLRAGRRRGVKFEVVDKATDHVDVFVNPKSNSIAAPASEDKKAQMSPEERAQEKHRAKPGHCVGCRKAFVEDGQFASPRSCSLRTPPQTYAYPPTEKETLIGFACGHVYHLSCLLETERSSAEHPTDHDPNSSATAAAALQVQFAADPDTSSRSVGAKVAHAHLIRNAIDRGCPRCAEVKDD
ncbi:vacuolar assembly protein-like protein [Phyllosticta citrichinensis]